MGTKFQPRADTGANWTSANPVLLANELALDTTAKQFKVGDGTSAWTALPYLSLNTGLANTWTAEQTFGATIAQAPGQGANNETPFLQAGDLVSDYVVSGLLTPVPSTASLSGTLAAGTAYVLGQRTVLQTAVAYTYAASSDTYVDLSYSGVLTYSAVANGATAPAVAADSLRLEKVVTSSTAITGVTQIANISPNFTPLKTNLSYNGSAQAIAAATFTPLIMPTLGQDALSEYNSTTGVFTPRQSGVYLVYITLEGSSGTSGGDRILVALNTTAGTDGIRVIAGYTSTGANLDISAIRPVFLTGGSGYYLNMYTTNADTLSGGQSNSLSIVRIY